MNADRQIIKLLTEIRDLLRANQVIASAVLPPGKKKIQRHQRIEVLHENPRRPGSLAHGYYAAAMEAKNVGDYITHFKPKNHKDARWWLRTNIRQGHMRVQ